MDPDCNEVTVRHIRNHATLDDAVKKPQDTMNGARIARGTHLLQPSNRYFSAEGYGILIPYSPAMVYHSPKTLIER
jgi:hypothetical protein